jgi:hypothetical protein
MPVPPAPIQTPLVSPDGNVSALWSRYFIESQRTLAIDVAPANARYLVLTGNPSLTQESNLGALSSGYLKITVVAGVASPSTTATIAASDITGTFGAVDGAALINLNGSNVTSGTIVLARGGTGADLSATGGTSQVLKQVSSGANVTVGQLASTDLSDVVSGSYTPTLVNVANLDASTAYSCQYVRVGSVVIVSGQVDVDPTAAADSAGHLAPDCVELRERE